MQIIIFQTGEPLHCDLNSRPMRAINLANKFIEKGHKVTILSARFDHYQKKHRELKGLIKINKNLEIRLLNSPGYKKNISLGRLLDHLILALNLLLHLITNKISDPDICIVGFPPIEASFILVNWFRKKNVLTLLDVKDLWPEIFSSRFPKKYKNLINLTTYPYKILSTQTIRKTNILISISEPFLEWAQNYSKRKFNKNDYVLPLACPKISLSEKELKKAEQWWKSKGVDFNKSTFCFVGNLSIAFQFEELSEAIKKLEENKINCQFIICGKGTNETQIKKLFEGRVNTIFPGWISSEKAYFLRNNCIASLAPYKNTEDFINSIPNKIIDSINYSLPVITTLKGRVKKMINDYQFGLFTENDSKNWYKVLNEILFSKNLRNKLSKNAYYLSKDEFDFEKIYDGFIYKVEKLYKEGIY